MIRGAVAQVKDGLKRLVETSPCLFDQAVEEWIVSPATRLRREAAVMLDNQMDRIRATEFAPLNVVVQGLRGVDDEYVGPTTARRFQGVRLCNGILRCGRARMHLEPRQGRRAGQDGSDIELTGAIYDSWVGRKWFGNWLLDDCLTWMLAEPYGAVTIAPTGSGHVPDYEVRLGLKSQRVRNAHFSELILFDDLPNNPGKGERARALRERLVKGQPGPDVPGVLIRRGVKGTRRVLTNEDDLADDLVRTCGFRVVEPEQATVDELVAACSGARVIVGVEGSQLAHGLAVMPDHAALLTLQPPDRVTIALKLMTDRRNQRFAAVIGERAEGGFTVPAADVRRTLDLLL
ncbi:MAG TPA: glycosyltransferase family 61 protein [Paracoccus sp. (in: a-proteobacteria)]|nr:glycosyltransferase family 61 protein [Paracoccus sp. (in: a-proteobacteria)]